MMYGEQCATSALPKDQLHSLFLVKWYHCVYAGVITCLISCIFQTFARTFITFEHIIAFRWNLVFLCTNISSTNREILKKNIKFWLSYWDFARGLFFFGPPCTVKASLILYATYAMHAMLCMLLYVCYVIYYYRLSVSARNECELWKQSYKL